MKNQNLENVDGFSATEVFFEALDGGVKLGTSVKQQCSSFSKLSSEGLSDGH
ncbi:hypothetical protein SESBI_44682 [Sesbania bispinosa]|nr:hypothetical protein SESBI_44682 [Sesbania bispinosa]